MRTDLLQAPTGTRWEVLRRWKAPGRNDIVAIRSEDGAVRHVSASEIETWKVVG